MNRVIHLKVVEGRKAVDAYREAHRQLHSKPWHRGIPEEHTPLLNDLLVKIKGQAFTSLGEFFDASEELNAKELGFTSRNDFEARATEADMNALEGMWR